MKRFSQAIIVVVILASCIVAVMVLSCFVLGDKKMLKNAHRGARPQHEPHAVQLRQARAWRLVVLVARLMYIFTLTFFYYMFRSLNEANFQTLEQYDVFALGRDAQLVNLSYETDRMVSEVDFREAYCNDVFRNTTTQRKPGGRPRTGGLPQQADGQPARRHHVQPELVQPHLRAVICKSRTTAPRR